MWSRTVWPFVSRLSRHSVAEVTHVVAGVGASSLTAEPCPPVWICHSSRNAHLRRSQFLATLSNARVNIHEGVLCGPLFSFLFLQ